MKTRSHMVRNCARMETTFYDEGFHHNLGNVNQLKRNLTLDLNQRGVGGGGAMKRQKLNNPQTPLLSSPDMHMLKLGTPELEKFIIASTVPHNAAVPPATPTALLFSRAVVTEEQERYVRGFEEALNELHNSDSSQGALQAVDLPVTTTSSSASLSAGGIITYTNLDQTSHHHQQHHAQHHPAFQQLPPGTDDAYNLDGVVIKDEPQTVPSMGSSPPLSPIDMENQERIKLERKRQRNRVAASKCRRRKLERISRLEDKVKLLKGENNELTGVVNKLKQQVYALKAQVMEHVTAGCQIMAQTSF